MMEPESTRQSQALERVGEEVETFCQQARSAAFSLYTISHACGYLPGAKESQCELANRLLAVVGVMSSLDTYLFAFADRLFLSLEEVDVVSKCVAACASLLSTIDAAVQRADEYLSPGSTLKFEKGMHRLVFTPEEGTKAQHVLLSTFHIVARMLIKARNEALGQQAERTDEETLERIRLGGAMEHKNIKSLDSLPSLDNAPQATAIPQVYANSVTYQQLPFTFQQPQFSLQAQTNTVPIWAHNQWPPSQSTFAHLGVAQRQTQTQTAMDNELGSAGGVTSSVEGKLGVSNDTPASTRENTPYLNPQAGPSGRSAQSAAKGKEKEGEPAFPAADFTNTNNERRRPSAPRPSNLEAYILRPYVHTINNAITWHINIEPLYLDDDAMENHLCTLGVNYSIINTIGELLPEQVGLIQAHTKSRRGLLVSVQQCAPADVATHMGTLQIKPVIFLIRTVMALKKEWEEEKTATSTSVPDTAQPSFKSFSNNFPPFVPPQPASEPHNNNNPFQTNGPVQADRFSLSSQLSNTKSLFPTVSLPSQPPNTTSLFPSTLFNQAPREQERSFDSPEEYKAYLKSQGEDCFLVEKDPGSHTKLQRYMTITTQYRNSLLHRDRSLEELRVEDYKDGRTGPIKLSQLFNNVLASQKPFGGQCSNPNATSGFSFADPPPIPNIPPEHIAALKAAGPPEGQFDRPSPFGQQHQPFGGPFGRPTGINAPFGGFGDFGTHTNTGPSLFGQKPPSNQGLFGQPAMGPSTGLFGAPASTSNQGLFGTTSTATSGSGLFGQPATGPSTGLFGAPASTSNQGLFGTTTSTATSGSGLFGQPVTGPSTGLFGAPASASNNNGWGVPNTGSFAGRPIFSSCSPPQKMTSATSGFSAFGTSTSSGGVNLFENFAKHPSTGLFGTASNQPFEAVNSTNDGSSAAPESTNMFARQAAAAAAESSSLPFQSILQCKICSTSLVFHLAAEKSVGQCDACRDNKETPCQLCERKLATDTTTDQAPKRAEKAPASATETTEGQPKTAQPKKTTQPKKDKGEEQDSEAEAKSKGKRTAKEEQQEEEEEDDDDDDDEEEGDE